MFSHSSDPLPDPFEIQSVICPSYCAISPAMLVSDAIVQMSQAMGASCDLFSQQTTLTPLKTAPYSCALVIEKEQVVGIITERDLVKLVSQNIPFDQITVKEMMTAPVITLLVDELIDPLIAYNLMRRHHIRHLPIVDYDSHPIGLLTLGSLRQSLHLGYFLRFRQAQEIMTVHVVCAPLTALLAEVVHLMTSQQVSCVVIGEPQDEGVIPVGMITERDIVQFQTMELNFHQIQAKALMSHPLFSIQPEESVLKVHQSMNNLNIRRMVVKGRQGELKGIITESDLSKLLDPVEIYGVLEIFQRRITQLEQDRALLLQGYYYELQEALARSEFCLYYQPQIQIQTGAIIGAEALIRWQSQKKGLISPAQFIPLAENSDLILPLGDWTLHQACSQIKQWQEQGFPLVPISVNVSSRQFYQPNLVTNIMTLLKELELEPQWLKLELTESILVENVEIVMEHFKQLNTLGIAVAIDDFGTGYASLGYLQHFPFQILKLDRCFVEDIHLNRKNAVITTAIIRMARQLDFTVIAEGVEKEQERDFLYEQGCELIQGHLISPPLPLSEFSSFLSNGKFESMDHG